MASYTHQYDTEGMRGKANEIKTLSSEYEQLMKRFSDLVNNLDQVWNAPATKTFQASFAEFQGTFNNFQSRMMNYSNELTNAANAQDEKNANDATRAGNL